MIDSQLQINASKALAWTLWLLTFTALITAWVVEIAFNHNHLAMLFGFTAACFSAVAAVRTIRCYAVRLANLTRMAYGLDDQDDLSASRPQLHTVREPAR